MSLSSGKFPDVCTFNGITCFDITLIIKYIIFSLLVTNMRLIKFLQTCKIDNIYFN